MIKKIRLILFGAALLAGVAPILSLAARPVAAQSSSSSAKKKTKTVSTKSKGKSRKKVAARPKGQAAPSADRIKEIQTALQKDGSYEGEPTGKWDAATEEAMRKYQDKNGVNPTGKIDAISLYKLGLGSETAGKGAPVPAASSSTAPPPASKPPASVSPTSE